MITCYVKKSDLSFVQEFPVPENLDEWHEVVVDSRYDYFGKTYDPESGRFIAGQPARLRAKRLIDDAAGNARARYVSAGQLVEEEYRLALQQTQAWRDAGSPADQVPPAIQAWADAAGITAEQAATSIEQTTAAWESVLLQIRQIRLAGKAAVDAAGDADDFAAIAQPFIAQLDAMQP